MLFFLMHFFEVNGYNAAIVSSITSMLATLVFNSSKTFRRVVLLSTPDYGCYYSRLLACIIISSFTISGPYTRVSLQFRLYYKAMNCVQHDLSDEVLKAYRAGMSHLDDTLESALTAWNESTAQAKAFAKLISDSMDSFSNQTSEISDYLSDTFKNCKSNTQSAFHDCENSMIEAKKDCQKSLGIVNRLCDVVDIPWKLCSRLDSIEICKPFQSLTFLTATTTYIKTQAESLRHSLDLKFETSSHQSFNASMEEVAAIYDQFASEIEDLMHTTGWMLSLFGLFVAIIFLAKPLQNWLFLRQTYYRHPGAVSKVRDFFVL